MQVPAPQPWDAPVPSQLLPAPGHLHPHRHLVLHRERQQTWWFDLEVRQFGRNGSGKLDVAPLAGKLEFSCLYCAVCAANWISRSTRIVLASSSDSGNRVRTWTIGSSPARVTCSMCKSRLQFHESKVFYGTAIRKSHCCSWKTPFPRAPWLIPSACASSWLGQG